MRFIYISIFILFIGLSSSFAFKGHFYDVDNKQVIQNLSCDNCESFNVDVILPHHEKIKNFDRIWMVLIFKYDDSYREYDYVLLTNEYDVKYGDSDSLRIPIFRDGSTSSHFTNRYNSIVPCKDMCKISKKDSTFIAFEVYGQTKTGTSTEWSDAQNRAVTRDTYSGTKIQAVEDVKLNQTEKQLKKNRKRDTWWYGILSNFPILGWFFN